MFLERVETIDRQVYLVSYGEQGSAFQGELLTYFFNNEFPGHCQVLTDPLIELPRLQETANGEARLIVFDCLGMVGKECRRIFRNRAELLSENDLVVFLNVGERSGVDQEALSYGVRGVFYVHDSIDSLKKGLDAVLAGKVWFSRKVLTDHLLPANGKRKKGASSKKSRELTVKQREILVLITVGATNEEIAEKMEISLNTVKTHLYNIFKKIKTSNRLQAALWASTNL